MKKQLMSMSAIALMVLASSCSKNEVNTNSPYGENVNPDRIAFRSTTTKANDNGLTELQGGFHVIGLDKSGAYLGGFDDPKDDSEVVVDNQWNVFYNYNDVTANKWDWKNVTATWNDTKLWPADAAVYPLTFFAAYPASTAITKDVTTFSPEVISNMTPDVNFIYNTYYNGQVVSGDPAKVSTDYLGALASVVDKPVSGFADLTFKHIMSNVQFEIVMPAGYKANIQAIRLANINKSGRSYDYKTATWGTEPAYDDATHAHFAHFVGSVKLAATGLVAGVNGNSLKMMPQTTVDLWNLGDKDAPAAGTFRADAQAWAAAHPDIDGTAIIEWHQNTTANGGMSDSEGWKGARIELTYNLVDNNDKDVIGSTVASAERFVRVGFPLDLANLKFKDKDGNDHTGFQAGYKYKFQIQLGTTDATNGVLLDPDYKDGTGGTTNDPVDNPKTTPGDNITKEGKIQFNVAVDEWLDATGVIK